MIKKILCCIIVLLVGNSAVAKNLPKKLKNDAGIECWYIQDKTSSVIHINIGFRNAGSSNLDEHLAGVPTLYAETLKYGAGRYSSSKITEKLSELMMKFSVRSGFDSLRISISFPSVVIDDAVDLINTLIRDPKFETEKFDLTKASIGYSISQYDESPVMFALSTVLPKKIFQRHEYSRGMFGNTANFMRLTKLDVLNYMKRYLVRKNACVCICGNISKKTANIIINKIFCGVQCGVVNESMVEDIEPVLSSEIERYHINDTQSTIVFVSKLSDRNRKKARYASLVLYRLLGGTGFLKSRIMEILRGKNGFIYSGGIHNVDLVHSSFALGYLTTSNSNVDNAIDSMKEIIRNVIKNGVTKEELDFVKKNFIGSFAVKLRTPNDICAFYFEQMLLGENVDVLEKLMNGINSVTLDDLNNVCKQILDSEKLSLLVFGGK